MDSSKAGIHINAVTDEDALVSYYEVAQPAVGLIIDHREAFNFLQRARQVSPNTIWIGRMYQKEQPLDRPAQRAEEFFDRIRRSRIYRMVAAWGGYNEIAGYPYRPNEGHENLLRFLEWEWALATLLNNDGSGFGEGMWSVGNPDLKWYGDPDFRAVNRISKFHLLHQYYAPTLHHPSQFDPVPQSLDEYITTGHYLFRHRLLSREELSWLPPIVATESGIDAGAPRYEIRKATGILRKRAWKDIAPMFTHDPVAWYLEQIRWLDSQYRRDPKVLGFCIYCAGTHDRQWEPFNIMGPMLWALGQYQASVAPKHDVAWVNRLIGLRAQRLVIPYNSGFAFDEYRQRVGKGNWEVRSRENDVQLVSDGRFVRYQVYLELETNVQHIVCAFIAQTGHPEHKWIPVDETGVPVTWKQATWHFDRAN